ncbi:hypothetical protein [uncultured Sphingomonas sp.]|uniref:hypothetical protein n=1 Tax=uncultured Sphingomonas sp. TaxID=158754 RepID=UPI0035C98A79
MKAFIILGLIVAMIGDIIVYKGEHVLAVGTGLSRGFSGAIHAGDGIWGSA